MCSAILVDINAGNHFSIYVIFHCCAHTSYNVNHSLHVHCTGPDGLCIRAPPGEPGELVGKISTTDALQKFDGYSTKAATSKKVHEKNAGIGVLQLIPKLSC